MANSERVLDESSPSVQLHLGTLQNIIQRMAVNSGQCKTWSTAIVSAILAIVANKSKPDHAWVALLPSILFLCLDVYYLALEKAFRSSYNDFVKKIHYGSLSASDLYSVTPNGDMKKHTKEAIKSFSIWMFYLGIIGLIALVRFVVLD